MVSGAVSPVVSVGAVVSGAGAPHLHLNWETELEEALKTAKTVIADPLFRPICPKEARWIDLPTEAFSGRIYRSRIPNLTANFEAFKKEVM